MKNFPLLHVLPLLLLACGHEIVDRPDISAEDALDDAAGDADAAVEVAADVAPDVDSGPPYAPDLPPVPLAADPTSFVDPRIGSDGSGNVFVGATLPHSMLKLGPDTDNGDMPITGYEWSATRVQGFSHTHLDGPGGSGYGYSQIALLPTMGTPTFDESQYAEPFTHDGEVIEPGYYAVTLPTHQIRAELAPSQHCGWHRYSFPPGTARLVVNVGHSRGESLGGAVQVANQTFDVRGDYNVDPTVAGVLVDKTPTTGLVSIFAHIQLDQPAVRRGVFQDGKSVAGDKLEGPNLGVWLEWDNPQAWSLNAQVCISLLSAEQAQKNAAELQNQTLESLRKTTNAAWNDVLGRVRVEEPDLTARTRFFTALYHAFLQPAQYTEDGKFWNGSKAKAVIQETNGRQFYTDNWCIWDTTRTVHPLLTLLQPEVVGDMLQSLVWLTGEDGYLPKCPWHASGDSRVMTGNFTFCVMADAVQKGLKNFDTQAAFDVMKHGALTDSVNTTDAGLCGYFNQGTPPFYVETGWVPTECDILQGASMTLEHAYSDWCLGQFAAAIGEKEFADQMHARSGNWKNTWGPHGFPQLRNADGTWVEPFDPKASGGFTEASAWIYEWMVPQDPCGLVAKLGGNAAALQRLNQFFDENHFDMGNEPDFHAPWLYHVLGRPDLSSDRVHALLTQYFATGPHGLPGNDDAGAMSAWVVFASLGLYPMTPGDGKYALTAPIYPRAELNVGGKIVRIEAPGAPQATHIVAAKWNGEPLETPWLQHSALAKGGFLELTLSKDASSWGQTGACP